MTLVEAILKAAEDDWIYLAEVASDVARYVGVDYRGPLVAPISLILVRDLVDRGYLEIGELSDEGFKKWNLPLDEAMTVLEREWAALERPISLSDVCWLCLTEAGHEVARTIPDEPDPF